MTKYVGNDISKDKFDIAIPTNVEESYKKYSYSNDEKGISEFITTLRIMRADGIEPHVVVEATGVYSLSVCHQLEEHGFTFSVINPLTSKRFSQTIGQSAKTDPHDAVSLSKYGQYMKPKATKLPNPNHYKIKQKRVYIKQLKKSRQAFKNILHAFEISPFRDEQVVEDTKKQVEYFNQEIKKSEKELQTFTKETYAEQYKLLTSIKGIGPKNAIALIYATDGFQSFEHPKKFARFVGIAPTVFQSGSSVRQKSRMNRSGDPEIRSLLYVATWSAIRFNKPCKQKYEELIARGKPPMVALVAIMNKLLRQAFGVIKSGEKFNNEYEIQEPEVAVA